MKRLDDGKVSLVEFLRSIKYARRSSSTCQSDQSLHFADFSPHARSDQKANKEELSLVRSNN